MKTQAKVFWKESDANLCARLIAAVAVIFAAAAMLRRNPNDAPDSDHTGYDFWLQKLNQFGGNFQNAEMVKAFISLTEYRGRFGQP